MIRGNGFDIRGPNGNNYFPVNHKLFYVVEIFGPIFIPAVGIVCTPTRSKALEKDKMKLEICRCST